MKLKLLKVLTVILFPFALFGMLCLLLLMKITEKEGDDLVMRDDRIRTGRKP